MNTPVINVNGQPVTRFELTNAMQEYALQMHDKTIDELEDAEHDEILQMSIEKLVVWELIYQRSVADGVEVGPEFLERSVRREVLVEGVLDRWFNEVPEPTEAEVDAGYEEYRDGRQEDGADETAPRDQAEPMIRSCLKQKVGTERIREWVEELRDSAEIEYMEDL